MDAGKKRQASHRLWACATVLLMLYAASNPMLGIALLPLLDAFGLEVLLLLISVQGTCLYREQVLPGMSRACDWVASPVFSSFPGLLWMPWAYARCRQIRRADS